MASASQLFKDDEDERSGNVPSDDALRHLTGITPDDEAAMERAARRDIPADIAAKENNPSGSTKQSDNQDKSASAAALQTAESGTEQGLGASDQLGKGFSAAAPELAL
ncbi:MAG TPA: hypothetical protein VFN56_03140, partial [Candidatus Saccharimonadales bacterium]|nr:hypothetical protein [Candidatus Saccharimonadales bacterium]